MVETGMKMGDQGREKNNSVWNERLIWGLLVFGF